VAGLILIGSLLLQLCQSPEGYNSGYPGPRAPLRLAPILLGYLSSRTVGSPLLRQQKGVWALGCFVLWYFIPGPKTPVASRCGSGGSQTSPSQSFASSDPSFGIGAVPVCVYVPSSIVVYHKYLMPGPPCPACLESNLLSSTPSKYGHSRGLCPCHFIMPCVPSQNMGSWEEKGSIAGS
jgi:hypothetical protein